MSDDDPIPLGGIIGIAVAGVGLVIVAVIIVYLVCTKYVKKREENKKKDVVYAEVGDYNNENSEVNESSHYAKVEFKKSDKFKKQKKKLKEIEKQKTVAVYAEINLPPQQPPQLESPEPRYANINIQSSV
jgi:uncharacterized membrane protein YhiD involved in acid resistance